MEIRFLCSAEFERIYFPSLIIGPLSKLSCWNWLNMGNQVLCATIDFLISSDNSEYGETSNSSMNESMNPVLYDFSQAKTDDNFSSF